MAQLSDSLSESRRYMAWAGSATDLLPVLESMERQFADVRSAHITEKTAYYRRDLERERTDLERYRASFASRSGRDAEAAEDDELIRMTTRSFEAAVTRLEEAEADAERFDEVAVEVRSRRGQSTRRTRGRPTEVIDYLAHLDVRSLELSAPAGRGVGHHVSVRFDDDGVHITASSTDSRWTSATVAQLSDALRRRVPWWRWMRSLWFLIPFIAIATLFVSDSLLNAVPQNYGGRQNLYAVVFLGDLLFVPLAVWAATRALPSFELTASERPTGARVVAFIGTSVAGVVLGVVGNLIS